jgi:hypothetical protein
MATFRSGTVTNTSTNVSTKGANVSSINIVNRHNAVIYVKFYNQTVATFQDTPFKTYAVAASGGLVSLNDDPLWGTTNGLCIRVVTDSTDNGNTAAATLPIIELEYN